VSRATYEPVYHDEPAYYSAPGPVYGTESDGALDERRSLLARLGPIGIAAIIAALLVSFGVAVAAASFLTGSAPSAQPPAAEPTPIEEASGPVAPPAVDASPSQQAASSAPASAKASASAAVRVTTNPGQEAAVVGLLNQERARARCRDRLGMDDRLRGAARAHSTDMATHGFFSHTGSDGSSPEQRMSGAGYGRPLAENLARGQRSAREVVRAWMGSPTHRRNILNCDARAVGVGLAIRNGNDTYWTLDLGR
jgi:uncharacterized protein YkwD